MIFLRKRLRRASLAGQWFYLNDTNIDTGRRAKRFEFPFQEKPQAQDLGKKGQFISIAGFVAGANYRSDAENLIKACEKKGPLELFHPYCGRKQVVCHSCRINENNIEGGIVYFSFQFFETVDTVSSRFGLGNLPLASLLGAADLLSSASQTITDAIDSANQAVGYVDQLNDSILMTTEFFEKMISPLLHAEDSINNLALALNDMRRTTEKDYYLGTTGMVHAMSNLLVVIAGSSLDDVDPYHWTHDFPPERIDPGTPFWPILLGGRGFVIGIEASQLSSHTSEDLTRFQGLQTLKRNIDLILPDAERKPEMYQKLKDLNANVIHLLFSDPLAAQVETPTRSKKCLILEAYENRGGLQKLDSIRNEYFYGSTL